MPKIYLVQEVVRLTLLQYPLDNRELEILKNELQYKTIRELENIIEKMEEEVKSV